MNDLNNKMRNFTDIFLGIETELARIIVGNREVVRRTLSSFFCGGHVLLEGAPGLGKTLLVKSVAQVLGLSFKRIQFTPDLMPSDVTGTQILTEDETGRRQFVFKPGPIFSNIVLADEINRSTPKTQSALLEAMEERQITVLDQTYQLTPPFFVLATQNPIELEGTYPLPEAQLDRFLMKLNVPAPRGEELREVLKRTTGTAKVELAQAFDPEAAHGIIQDMKSLVREVHVPDPMIDVVVRIISNLTPGSEHAHPKVGTYVRFGPGPRGAQATLLIAKVTALLDGRIHVSFEDIKTALLPALRHRIVLNFRAEADGVTSDELISALLQ
jgi:MoxR-like ATPase